MERAPRPLSQTLLAATLLFALFASYGILKPLRDNVGQYFGRALLPSIWLGTALTTVAATALLGVAVARWPRRRFAPWIFGLCAAITAAAYLAYRAAGGNVGFWLPAAFYWWVSSYLMVGLALFWGLMADTYGPHAGRRAFGPIAFAGTLGQLGGATFTEYSVQALGLTQLLAIALGLLIVATVCVIGIVHTPASERDNAQSTHHAVIGGRWFDGFVACVGSPYLGAILAYVGLQTFASTVLTLEVVDAVKAHFGSGAEAEAARTAFNASIDKWTQAATLVVQLLLVGPLLSRLGAGVALAVQPLAFAIGFSALALVGDAKSADLLTAVACFEVTRRAANYGFAKPGRDLLFTVCSADEKYKAKSAIDAAGFRMFDYVFAVSTNWWRTALMSVVGSGLVAAAVVTVPIALGWAFLSLRLGGMYRRRTRPPVAAGL